MKAFLGVAAASAAGLALAQDPSFDHQTQTYTAQLQPASASSSVSTQLYFSPEHSSDTTVNLINSVAQGGTIDIGTPGFDSWSPYNCTYGTSCVGCTVKQQAAEPFPVFGAVLNAIHQKGATVRVVTNDYGVPTCTSFPDGSPGTPISPLDFWALNGVQVKMYVSTTFIHAKYMRVQTEAGYVTSISSINYSNSSYTKNREAGVLVFENSTAGADIAGVAVQGFEYDFSAGYAYTVGNTYDSTDMAVITSSAPYSLVVPEPRIAGSYISPAPATITFDAASEVYASPDFSRSSLMADLQSVQSSLEIYIYQVTDSGICQQLLNLYNNGVNVTLLVSRAILDNTDWSLAQACYKQLYYGGMNIQKSPDYYEFAHQKFWIIDGDTVGLSTGNWSPSDYPAGTSFPPYGNSGWQDTNRDFTFRAKSAELASVLRGVLNGDYARGTSWHPY